MKRRIGFALALAVAVGMIACGPLPARAETTYDVFRLGENLIVPDGWHIEEGAKNEQGEDVAKGTEGSFPNATFSYPEDVVKSTITLQVFSEKNGRVLTAMRAPNSIEKTGRQTVETLGLGNVDTVSHFSYWCAGNPVRGVRMTGTYKEEPWILMLCYFPSTDDQLMLNMYRIPADGSVDAAWFTSVMEKRFPELVKLGLSPSPAATDAPAQGPAPTATPKPDIAALNQQEVAALTPPALGVFFAEDAAKTYLRMAEVSGLSLAPAIEWAKIYGLDGAAVTKDGTLSFAVAKAHQQAWGGVKKLAIPVPADAWIDRKGLRISMEGMRLVASGFAEAWTAPSSVPDGANTVAVPSPKEVGEQFARDPAAAYFAWTEVYGVPLAPIAAWAKTFGLDAPAAAKEGPLSLSVAQKRQTEWGGTKKVIIPVPADAWVDRKGLRISMDGLRQVITTLAETWTEPTEPAKSQTGTSKSDAIKMKTPLMTEEAIREAFPNYEWVYTETSVQAEIAGQIDAYEDMRRYTYKQCPGGYYDESVTIFRENTHAYGNYIPLGEPFYYSFNSDGSATINIQTKEVKESYAGQHPLAWVTTSNARHIDMRTIKLMEEGVDIAGRSTTQYYGEIPHYGAGIDLWVDDELGIVLKSAMVSYQYGNITTFETTHLAFDGVTLGNIFDADQYYIADNYYEEASDTTTPRGRDLIASADSLRKKFPYLHVAYAEGYRWYAEGQEESRDITLTLGVNHQSKGGTYTLSTSLSEPNGSGRYWKAREKEYCWFWMGNPNPDPDPLDENARMQFDLYGGLPNIEGDRYADIRLYLEEENTQIAGRPAKRYSGKISGSPFQIWIDDEHRFVLKSIVMNREGTMMDSMMEITSLALEDQGFPALEEAREALMTLEKEAADESVRTKWIETLESLGNVLAAPSPRGGLTDDGEVVPEWSGLLVLSSPQEEDGIRTVKHWDRQPAGDVVVPGEVDDLPVIAIGEGALMSGHAITSVDIPQGVSSIGADAFSNCGNMVSVTLPEGLTRIGKGAFSFCQGLTEVTLPGSLSHIGDLAFAGCYGLTEVVVPNSVTDLGNCAFAWCEGLIGITLPEDMTRLSDQLFDGCVSLQRVQIPDGVTHIGMRAFTNCAALTDVTIPSGVTYIGDDAFEGCANVTLNVQAGGYAEQYAKANNIAYTTYTTIQ